MVTGARLRYWRERNDEVDFVVSRARRRVAEDFLSMPVDAL